MKKLSKAEQIEAALKILDILTIAICEGLGYSHDEAEAISRFLDVDCPEAEQVVELLKPRPDEGEWYSRQQVLKIIGYQKPKDIE